MTLATNPEHFHITALMQEWTTLQTQCEQHERNALLIKLTTVVLVSLLLLGHKAVLAALLIAVLWGQEAIIRTMQTRLSDRLLQIEIMLRGEIAGAPCQLHSNWQQQRGGVVKLVGEYVRHAVKPTVLYPYVMLAILVFFAVLH